MKRVKNVALAIAALPIVAGPLLLGTTPTGQAATATMSGLFGTAPNFSSITVDGTPLCPCRPIDYNTMPGLIPIADGVQALDRWISTTSGTETVIAYSKGTHSALGWLRDNADETSAHRVQFILLGSPETPGNGRWSVGHKLENGLPDTEDFQNVTFVVRQYDSIADAPMNKFNILAAVNSSFSAHLEGYDGLDLDNPDAVYVDPDTGAKTLYFRTDVLPMLQWMDWFVAAEQLAEWDATLRPLIEAAYDRPVAIPDRTDARLTGASGPALVAAAYQESPATDAAETKDTVDAVTDEDALPVDETEAESEATEATEDTEPAAPLAEDETTEDETTQDETTEDEIAEDKSDSAGAEADVDAVSQPKDPKHRAPLKGSASGTAAGQESRPGTQADDSGAGSGDSDSA